MPTLEEDFVAESPSASKTLDEEFTPESTDSLESSFTPEKVASDVPRRTIEPPAELRPTSAENIAKAFQETEFPGEGVQPIDIPVVGKEGSLLRGVSKGVSGLVHTITSPEGLAIGAALATPVVGEVVGPVMVAGMLKSAVELGKEAYKTGSLEPAGEALVVGGMAGLGMKHQLSRIPEVPVKPEVAQPMATETFKKVIGEQPAEGAPNASQVENAAALGGEMLRNDEGGQAPQGLPVNEGGAGVRINENQGPTTAGAQEEVGHPTDVLNKPLYHGSFETGLTELKPTKIGDFGSGVYLTNDPKLAGRFADSTAFGITSDERAARGSGKVYDVELAEQPKNPWIADDTPLTNSEKNWWNKETEDGLEDGVETRSDLADAVGGSNYGPWEATELHFASKDWNAFAKAFNHDALVIGKEVVIKDPSLVKIKKATEPGAQVPLEKEFVPESEVPEPSTNPPEPTKTTRRKIGVDRPEDVIDVIKERIGKIRSPRYAKPGSEGYYTPELKALTKSGASRELFDPEGSSPDEILDGLKREGYLGEDAVVGDIVPLIEKANTQRRAVFRGETPEIQGDKFQKALTDQSKKKSSHVVSVGDLSVGDKFVIGGEEFEVKSIDPDTGDVAVKDGKKFGYQTIPDGADLHVQKGSLEQKLKPIEFGSEDFGLAAPESVEQQKTRMAHEEAVAKQKAADEALVSGSAKPLVGSVGDIGQKDMFGGGDLFSEEPPIIGMGGAAYDELGNTVNVVSNMKAIINQDRLTRGEEVMPETTPRTWEEDRVAAEGVMKSNPNWIPDLIQENLQNPRPLSSKEVLGADLQRAYWSAELNNAWRRIEEARRDGREADQIEAQNAANDFKGKLDDMDRALGTGGGAATEAGRSLAAQQAGITNDLDIVRVRLEREAALGRPLEADEIADLQRMVDQYKAAKDTLAAELETATKQAAESTAKRLVAEHRADLAEKALPPPQVMQFIGEVRKSVKEAADKSREYFQGKFLELSPEDLFHLSRIALDNLLEVGEDFGRWSAKMAADLGTWAEKAKPYFQNLFDHAKKARYEELEKKGAKRTPALDKALKEESPAAVQEKVVTALKEAKSEGVDPGELQKYIKAIVKTVIEEGEMEHNAIFEKTGDILRKAGIDLTLDDLQRIYGGYGKSTPAPTERVPVRMAQLRGESQKFQGLKTVLDKNTPPLATGPRRVKQSDLARRTAQKIHEAMKERGVATQTTEAQLAGALDARKNYRRNRIKDLRHEIATGKKNVKGKSVPLSDAELEVLDREYQQLKREHEAAFPKQPLTDEQRIATELRSLDREIASTEDQIKTGNVLPKEQAKRLSTPALESKRARLQALRDQRQELRDLNQEWQDKKEAENLERKKVSLLRQIDEKTEKVAAGDTSTKATRVNRPLPPEIEPLQQQVDALNKQINELRNPKKTRDQIASEAAIRYANNKIAEMHERMARGDFEPKTPPVKPTLNAAAQTARAEMAKIKLDYERAKAKNDLSKRTKGQRLMDGISRWKRNAVLTYPTILGKLTAAAAEGIAFSGIEGGIAKGYSRVLPKSVVEGAIRYGRGTTASIEAEAMADTVTHFVKNFKDAIKTGNIELDLAHGKPDIMPPHMLDWIGNIHYALKTPLMQNEWSRSFKTIMRNEALNGVDTTNPAVMERIGNQAYRYAKERLFLDDNKVVDAYNSFLKTLTRPDKTTGKPSTFGKVAETALRYELPIVRIPTNIIKRAFEYQFGSLKGGYNLLDGLRKGIDTLSSEEKDVIIRNLSRGSLGAALMLYGWFNSDNIGGYYQPNEKKPKVPYGGMTLFGAEIPRTLLHHPALEPIQFGATAHHVFNKLVNKKEQAASALGEAGWASLMGLTEEVPFSGQIKREIRNSASGGKAMGELVKSAVPGFAQYIAGRLDLEPGTGGLIFGTPRQRTPKTFVQTVEMGIPGMRQNVPKKVKK